MTPPTLRESVLLGLKWSAISRAVTQAFTWAATFLVVRLLSPVDYGLVAMATIITGYLAIWNELGFSVTIVQRQNLDDATLRNVFGMLLLAGGLICAATVLSAPLVALGFHEQAIVPLAELASLNFLMMPFSVIPQAKLAIDLKFKSVGILNLTAAITTSVTTLGLAYLGYGAYSLIWGSLLGTLVRTAGLNVLSPYLRWPHFSTRNMGELASFSGIVLLSRTIWYWYVEVDILIVGRLLGASSLGLYSLGRQLAIMPMERASEIINAVSLPAYASVKNDLAYVARGYLTALRVGATASFPIFWGLALVSEDLVHVVLGERWAGATPVIQLLCISMPLRTLGTLAPPALTAVGRPGLSLRYVLLPAILVPLCIMFGARWGMLGVATAWAIGYPVAFVIATGIMGRTLNLARAQQLRPLVAPLVAAAIMCVFVTCIVTLPLAARPALLRLLLDIPLGAGIYLTTLWMLDRQRVTEMVILARGIVTGGN